ncbi:MAG: hypothetical protein Q9187_001688 [Circinaria calcarea]
MAITKILLSALAIVSTASAVCSIPSSSTTTISDPAGATALATCTTFSGNVLLATGVANAGTVNIDGIQAITGGLSYQDDDSVLTFRASQLTTTGDLSLGALSQLSQLSLTALGQVAALNFSGLSSLQSLDFTSGITRAASVLITNTQLNSLRGIDGLRQVQSFDVNNNPFLDEIALSVASIRGSLNIGANDVQGEGLSVSFPNLITAGEITIRNTSSIEIPALSNVTQNLGFYGNNIESLSAPNLTSAGGIVFVGNADLTSISMPLLTTINGRNGTYQIANNTLLRSIDGFENLSNVNGDLDFSGNFTSVMLPGLKNVNGAMNVQTSATFDCTPIQEFRDNQTVKGALTCAGQQSAPGGAGTTPTGSGSSASPTGQSAAGHFDVNVPMVTAGTLLAVGLLQMLL